MVHAARTILAAALIATTLGVAHARTLVWGGAVYRHGDRTALHEFPKDPANAFSTWEPPGPGRLTTIGMLGEYNMGAYLRSLFIENDQPILNSTYELAFPQLYVRSTAIDRALQSAQAQLAGMFAPLPVSDEFLAGLEWAPVPVHSEPTEEDYLLQPADICPSAQKLGQQSFLDSDEYAAKVRANEELFRKLETASGSAINMENFKGVLDAVWCEQAHNRTVLPGFLEVLPQMEALDKWYQANRFKGPIRLVTGGFLVQEMYERMVNISSGRCSEASCPRVAIFSAHDTTLVGLLTALGFDFGGVNPPYSSRAVFRLYRETDGSYTVNILYNNAQVLVGDCGAYCPLEQFSKNTADVRPLNGEEACFGEPKSHEKSNKTVVVLAVFVAVLVLVVLALGMALSRAKAFRGSSAVANAEYQSM